MISRFFIDRPIFAAVLSLAITIAGGVALLTLPITQYPEIAPPTVNVSCSCPGASAQVVADTVAAPIEQQVNGVENMLYMASRSANDGSYSLNVTGGPVLINRCNMYTAAAINGAAAPGVSSGQATALVGELAARELSPSTAAEWTEIACLELLAGSTALLIFPLCILFVFLTHSAEYESWLLPLAIILIVPMSLLCALAGTHLRGLDRRRAAVEASRLRLRPILMTSFAFILGVVPLVLARGAGAEMRVTLGVGVFSGMLGVTFFSIFLTPVFYYVRQGLADRRRPRA